MKRLVVGGAILALGVTGAGISQAGTSDGQGAQKRGLFVTDESGTNKCQPSKTDAAGSPSGFVILNAPGKVGSVEKVVGEVSLKTGSGSYMVDLAVDRSCMTQVGLLTTNDQGNGNFHISMPTTALGKSYYVVLRSASGGDDYASAPVMLQ